jgi:hypothetical protein
MNRSTARVTSERASIYLQQLCKHFGHRIPVEFTPERGVITFAAGTCRLAAADGVLTLQAEAPTLCDWRRSRTSSSAISSASPSASR